MDEEYTDEQIRDWYAGQALIGLLASRCHPDIDPVPRPDFEKIATVSFDISNAMMAEREKRWKSVSVRPESQQIPINPS